MKRILLFLLLYLCFSSDISAQTRNSYLSAASMAYNNEDYASALNLYLQSLEFDDEDPYVMMRIGDCYKHLFEYKTALAWFNKALISDEQKKLKDCIFLKSETQLCMGDPEDARLTIMSYVAGDSADSYIKSKSAAMILRIDSAAAILERKPSVEVNDAGKNVNTSYSDFAPFYMNDTTLLFSSLRFEGTGSKKNVLSSMTLIAKADSLQIYKPQLLKDEINNPSWHNCNASVSPDGKLMVFSRCNYNENNKLVCSLYESTFTGNKWQTPVKLSDGINTAGFTSTQPCITSSGIEGYVLFFVSDIPGGSGQTDIYRSLRNSKGKYTRPENAGRRINTSGKEASPFFNPVSGKLYFSSDSLPGLGAFDIYSIVFSDTTSKPVNAGLPYNSGYNDLYYSQSLKNETRGYLSSNRPGTLELGDVCCYDIFRFSEKVEEIAQIPESSGIIQPLSTLPARSEPADITMNLKELLPLKLYFDNDHPDPGSRKSTTTADYETLYNNYITKIESYIQGFTTRGEASRDSIERFFIAELQYNYKQLDKFSNSLLTALNDSNTVILSVQGFASPLAETQYNLILSGRRIVSLSNFWKKWNNGALNQFISGGKLKLIEEPAGERMGTDVSDKLEDRANSVYNPAAARERRIEVIDVQVTKQ